MTPERFQRIKQVLNRRQPDLTVLTEDVHKPHNVSAIIRTSDAIGILEVHSVNLVDEPPIFNQVARGSQKWVNLHTYSDIKIAITGLQQQGFKVYAAHLSDRSINYCKLDYTKPTAILLGAEKWGVSEEAAREVDEHIIIPMLGMVQSLNVSVAAAVILFEAQRQRLKAGYYDRVRLDKETYDRLLFEWCYPEIASNYRQQGKAYPNLGEDGEILEVSQSAIDNYWTLD